MRTMLVGVEPTDPATFVAMAVGFLVDRGDRVRGAGATRGAAGSDGRAADRNEG